ncbi:MAG: PQQ-dependent sugar dehydrogenase [bacterium]
MTNAVFRPRRWTTWVVASLLAAGAAGNLYGAQAGSDFGDLYAANCAVCHGENLEGAAQGAPLLNVELKHGQSVEQLISSISTGFPARGMPGWQDTLTREQIKSLALWISENRSGLLYSDFKIDSELRIPEEIQHSEHHSFIITTVANNIDPLPFSIAPLPDGRILVTEKMRGLRIVAANGELSPLITGTPQAYADARTGGGGLEYGMGWLLDVALHPDFDNNGWIYLHYTDRCEDCNDISRKMQRPVSMNALVRGRIEDNRWVDEEVIWKADLAHYSPASDVAAGGRLAFDPDGFVFLSIGMQSIDLIQDLSAPHGKILRLHDDGRIPADNPFIDHPTANKAIWSYGHRSPQGLEFDPIERKLWETEHGPRGGDEVNLLLPGHNYGWPAFSKGQNYNGSQVSWGKAQGSELSLGDIDQPVVDLTPSPAVSSFVLYEAAAFPAWQHQFLVGSLKAADVFRLKIVDDQLVEQELLIEDLARIRDIEVDHNGHVLLLLEHASGGKIVRISPVRQAPQTAEAAPPA